MTRWSRILAFIVLSLSVASSGRAQPDPDGNGVTPPSSPAASSPGEPSAPEPSAPEPSAPEPSAPEPSLHRLRALEGKGDPALGRRLFEDEKRTACTVCHTITGKGGRCGPDLLGIADKHSREKLITSILEPSASLLPGYTSVTAVLRSGETKTGILWRRGPDVTELRDAENRSIRLPSAEIVEIRDSEVSLMPTGLEGKLTPEEFAALVSYLGTLERPLDARGREGMRDEISALDPPVELVPLHGPERRFEKPVWIGTLPVKLPGTVATFVVLEHRRARIWLLEKRPEGDRKTLFADLRDEVSDGPWEGLVALAFHPDFATNRRYFLNHEVVEKSENETARYTLVVERRASEDFRSDSGIRVRELLRIRQPAHNHNGGTALFGPDGFLYVALGDGGPQEDPNGYSQNPTEFLGALLRIDVDREENGKPYGIPPSNPWAKGPAEFARPEVWANGFREPWRFSFDPLTGDLWMGDVGQNSYEEIAVVRAGENHGWNVYEGFVPFSARYRREGETYVAPVFAYGHKFGVSVTGGHVFRGDPKSSFFGVYIFGDYESKRVWGLRAEGRRLVKVREIARSPQRIASFGVDDAGRLYIVGYEGTVFRMDFSATAFD